MRLVLITLDVWNPFTDVAKKVVFNAEIKGIQSYFSRQIKPDSTLNLAESYFKT